MIILGDSSKKLDLIYSFRTVKSSFFWGYKKILSGGFSSMGFLKGTKIATQDGYKFVEEVQLSDKILTKTGLQKINSIDYIPFSNKSFCSIKVRLLPDKISCDPKQLFFIKMHKTAEPVWKEAIGLQKGDYFGLPVNTKMVIPTFEFKNQRFGVNAKLQKLTLDNPVAWRMLGYFLGDGWALQSEALNSQYTISFRINNKDEKDVFSFISKILPITYCKGRDSGKSKVFSCNSFIWHSILTQFGKGSSRKKIPEWVQDAPCHLIQEFLYGYVKADGHIYSDKSIRINTTSPFIALGVQRLRLKLGQIFPVCFCPTPEFKKIKGKLYNQEDIYNISGKEVAGKQLAFFADGFVWFPFGQLDFFEAIDSFFYLLKVESVDGFIVENVIVK